MKFLLPLTLLIAFFISNANASNSLDSIFFKPESKEIISKTSYNYTDDTYIDDVDDKQEDRKQTAREEISIGITKKLHVDLEISYVNENNKDAGTSIDQSDSVSNNGFTNPKISLHYRIADKINNGYFSDVKLAYSPNIINSKLGDSKKGGNVASGRSEYEVAGSYGMMFDKVSFKVDLSVRYLDDAKIESMYDHVFEKTDSSLDTEFGVTGQYRFNKNLSLNASLSQLLRGSFKIDKANKIVGRDEVNIGTQLNYSIVPDKALISIAYNYVTVEDVYNTDSTGTVVTSSDRNRDEIEVSFKYKF